MLLGALALAAAVALSPTGTGDAQTMPNPWLTQHRILNLAHGGGLHEAPQGTLYAYKTALDRGANALEIDVHITRDGHVVAIHDSTVDRTTDGSGCVATKTLAELKALDAAHTFVPGRGPVGGLEPTQYPLRGVATGAVAAPAGFSASDFTIATLEEIFQAQPDALMVIELKPTEVYQDHDCPGELAALPPAERPDLSTEVARLIDAYGMTDKVMVASFIDETLHHFMDLAPGVATSFPMGESVALYLAHVGGQPFPNPRGHEAIQVPRSYGDIEITEELVGWSRDNGVAVHFWTINDPAEMELLLGWGADGLITDRPSVLAALLPDTGTPVEPEPPTTTEPVQPGGPTPPAGPAATAPSTPSSTSTTPTTSTTSTPTSSTTGPTASPDDPTGSTAPDTTAPGSTAPTPATPSPGTPGGAGTGGATDGATGGTGGAGDEAARPSEASRPLARTGFGTAAVAVGAALLAAGAVVLLARNRSSARARTAG